MKKAVAILLCAGMAFTLFGCSNSKETKKTRKTKHTKEEQTEEITEEPSDDPTEQTEPTNPATDPSDDPTTPSSPAVFDNTPSENLHSTVVMDTHGYAELFDDNNYTRVIPINYELNRIEFTQHTLDTYPALTDNVSVFYQELGAALTQRFEEKKAAGDLENSYYENQCEAETDVYRDDSYIFSFKVSVPSDLTGNNDGCYTHTYWTETGEEILLSDIVTNDYILTARIVSLGMKYNIPDENITRMKDSVSDGTADFALTYDGLVLFDEYYNLKLPFDLIEEGVDSKYFGHAPEIYFLDFNLDGSLKWDMNGDGTPEDIYLEPKFENPNDSILVTSVVIHVGDEACEVKEGIWGEFYPQYGSFYLMKTPDNSFIYMSVGIDEGIEEVCYRYDNDTWTYIGSFESNAYEHPYDPSSVKLWSYIGNIGTNYMYSYYDMVLGNGMPEPKGDPLYSDGYYLVTDTDLTFTMYNFTNGTSEDWKATARSTIQVLFFDYDSNLLFVYVYSRQTGEYVFCSIEMKQDNGWTVQGIPVDEAFLGVHYAG